jgi:hypothetical protein
VLQHPLAAHALAVDVRAVQAAEVAQHELGAPLFDEAVLFRDDFVEQLDGVVRVPAERVGGTELDGLLAAFRGN